MSDPGQPEFIVNLRGDKVALGPLRRELVPLYQRWINDLVTMRTLALPARPMTLEAETGWYSQMSATSDTITFTVYATSDWAPVGVVDLRNVDYRNRSATFGIMIGEQARRGQGLGTEATKLTLDYAFHALGLHNVMLTVYAFNPAGLRAYEKAGFREIGRRRQCRWLAGRLWDEIFMDCLSSEFVSPVLARLMAPEVPVSAERPDENQSG